MMTDQTSNTAELPNIFPVLRYADAPKALEWLQRAFGFRVVSEVPGPDGTIAHAEISLGSGIVMIGSGGPGHAEADAAADPSTAHQSIYIWVRDVDAHAARARSAGAEITREPAMTDYGSREYAARDLEGNHWSFGTYLPRADQG